MKFMAIIVSVLVLFPATVWAQSSVTGYSEVRYDFNGQGNPSAPAATNYSDVAVCIAGYNAGMDVCTEGRWQFYKGLPVSVGARYQYQMQKWSSRDEHLLGPTLQLKLGTSLDVTFRLELLVDLLERDMGIVHPYVLVYKQWQVGQNTYQLNFQAHYQFHGPDRHALDSGYYVASEHQVSGEIDGAWHPSGWKYIYPLVYVGGAGYWNSSRTYTSNGEFPAAESRGLFNLGAGVRGEIGVGQAVIWYQARVGYQGHFGAHHLPSSHGVAVLASIGLYIKHVFSKK